VEYCTRRKHQGKKLEATVVRVVPAEAVLSVGRVTHWVPEQLAGVISTLEGDVLVSRGDFIPGGFVPDIVGRQVQFRLDRARMEAASVQCLDRGPGGLVREEAGVLSLGPDTGEGTEEEPETLAEQAAVVQRPELDYSHPAVAWALGDGALTAALTEGQLEQVMVALSCYLSALARHPTGHRTVLRLLQQLPPPSLDIAVQSLGSDLLDE
jgi:hypothetical protein